MSEVKVELRAVDEIAENLHQITALMHATIDEDQSFSRLCPVIQENYHAACLGMAERALEALTRLHK